LISFTPLATPLLSAKFHQIKKQKKNKNENLLRSRIFMCLDVTQFTIAERKKKVKQRHEEDKR
jgi:hypothetical protein